MLTAERMGYHLMAKPTGPACNLNCAYCFYTEKQALFGGTKKTRMSEQVLEQYIKKYISGQDAPEISFVWQGGEPALMGVDFFKCALRLQKKYAGGKKITNSLQTNGTLINESWCRFLVENRFLVGLSLDGPAPIHDRYRVDSAGRPTFQAVLKTLKLLQHYRVDYNVLACVTRESAYRPLEVYRFLKEEGVQFIQFIPVVERMPDEAAKKMGLRLAVPPAGSGREEAAVMPFSVEPEAYGDFLSRIFDEWVRHDVGATFVMNFEAALGAWMGLDAATCVFARQCGRSLVMEHNGEIFSCDHYVYPSNRLGNILTDLPHELISSRVQAQFGRAKESALPRACRHCSVLFACRGECPKHRFLKTEQGEPGLNYLCKGYQKFFSHIDKYMRAMAAILNSGYPAETIMEAVDGPLLLFPQRD
jgi:uncharacterized protein